MSRVDTPVPTRPSSSRSVCCVATRSNSALGRNHSLRPRSTLIERTRQMFPPLYQLTPSQIRTLQERQRQDQLRLSQLLAAALRSAPPVAPPPRSYVPVNPRPSSHEMARNRDAVSGHFVTPRYAAAHPRTTELDHMTTPSIRSGPTRFVYQRTDNGHYVTEDFARQYPHVTVRTRVPIPSR